jgi:hypothetical protein
MNFAGKQSRNQRLKDLVNDDKVSSADQGWIKQEMNEVAAGKKGHLRNPSVNYFAHERNQGVRVKLNNLTLTLRYSRCTYCGYELYLR